MFAPYSDDFLRIRWLPLSVARPFCRGARVASYEPDSSFKVYSFMSLNAHLYPSCIFPSVSYLKFYGLEPFCHQAIQYLHQSRLQFWFSYEPRSSFSISESIGALYFKLIMSLETHFMFPFKFIFKSSAYEPKSPFIIPRFSIKFHFERILSPEAHLHPFWFHLVIPTFQYVSLKSHLCPHQIYFGIFQRFRRWA